MALAFLLDEHLRGRPWKAIRDHNAGADLLIDAVRVGDFEDLPLGSSDPRVLQWAADHDRILVTLDQSTMPVHLADYLATGAHSPGVLVVRPAAALTEVVEMLSYIAQDSGPADWADGLHFIP